MITTVTTEDELVESVRYAADNNLKLLSLGYGSNIVFRDGGFDGLIILNRITGYNFDKNSGLLKVNSGENWDKMVDLAVSDNWCGIESLSYIPGTAGAAPINNIGAYGQELKDTLVGVRAYDIANQKFVEFSNSQCDFSYRNSRFKAADWGRYVISQITLQLKPVPDDYQIPSYKALTDQLAKEGITKPKPKDIRGALKIIRASKLPDPSKLANTGSFFKNPTVSKEKAASLSTLYPSLPLYNQPDGSIKVAAGWLIDNAGLKNYRQNGMWVYDQQALVLVNESAKSFNDLQAMYKHIIDVVDNKYNIKLEPEPEIV